MGGVRCVGHGHGGSVGIRTLGGGVVIFTLRGVGAVGTLGSIPRGSVLAFHASGEEVGYPGLRAGCRVHDCVGKLVREEVGIVWVCVPGGGYC